jgi:hypothetical protein
MERLASVLKKRFADEPDAEQREGRCLRRPQMIYKPKQSITSTTYNGDQWTPVSIVETREGNL